MSSGVVQIMFTDPPGDKIPLHVRFKQAKDLVGESGWKVENLTGQLYETHVKITGDLVAPEGMP